jgi:hypothetical protein
MKRRAVRRLMPRFIGLGDEMELWHGATFSLIG